VSTDLDGLRPHQVRTLKLSTDPKFAAKVEDIRRAAYRSVGAVVSRGWWKFAEAA
jgi:hypothetical protein